MQIYVKWMKNSKGNIRNKRDKKCTVAIESGKERKDRSDEQTKFR